MTAFPLLAWVALGLAAPTAPPQVADEAAEVVALLDDLVARQTSSDPEALGVLREELPSAVEMLLALEEAAVDAPGHPVPAAAMRLAHACRALGAFEEERRIWTWRVAQCERTLDAGATEAIRARQYLAIASLQAGRLAEARAAFEGAVEILERSRPPEDDDLLDTRHNLAAVCMRLGDRKRASELLEDVLAIRERILDPRDADLLATRQNVAQLRSAAGDHAGALALYEEVLAVCEEKWAPTHPSVLDCRFNVAACLRSGGRAEEAVEIFRSLLEIHAGALAKDHPTVLRVKQNLAAALKDLWRYDEACALQEEVLEARVRTLPPDHLDRIAIQQNLASTLLALGHTARARRLMEGVVEGYDRVLLEGHPDRIAARHTLARVARRTGDYLGARVMLEEVLDDCERHVPGQVAGVLVELARTLVELGELGAARSRVERALELVQEQQGLAPEVLAEARLALARVELARGEHAAALAILREVFPVLASSHPPEHPMRHVPARALGHLEMVAGDPESARAIQEELVRTFTELYSEDHQDLRSAHVNLAWTLRLVDDEEALRRECELALRGLIAASRSLVVLSPREARAVAGSNQDQLHGLLSLIATLPEAADLERLAFEAVESLRHATTLGARAPAVEGDGVARLREELSAARARVQDLVGSLAGAPGELQEARPEIASAARERDRLERALRAALDPADEESLEVSLKDVSERLRDGAAAVAYCLYERSWFAPGARCPSSRVVLLAHVVRPDGGLVRVELGSYDEIEAAVETWRGALGLARSPRGVSVVADAEESADRAEASAGEALRRLALDPVLAAFEGSGVRELFVVSDGALHAVPIDALPWEDGRVGDEFRVHALVSFGLRGVDAERPGGEGLLALGGVDYAAGAAPPGGGSRAAGARFLPLEHTRAEVERLAELFATTGRGAVSMLLGEGATKAALFEAAAGRRYVHLATHGYFDPPSAPSRGESTLGIEETVRGFAPMALCGLALAGANAGPDELARVPGLLTAEELVGLDLTACELAVLSACDTNVGVTAAGRGILSLQAALHAAGAQSALTSLWSVDDTATRRLMELFYTGLWRDGLGKQEALWRAKATLRAESHPLRDWAGWVLTGDAG